MKNLLVIIFSFNIVFPNVPKTLKGQQNKSKINLHHRYIDIEKANICYVYGPKGDKVISVNFDSKNNLISKTNYKIKNKDYVFTMHDNCTKLDCLHFIHR